MRHNCAFYAVDQAVAVARKYGEFDIAIRSVCAKNDKKPTVTARVAFHNGNWVFTDFRYPLHGRDLLKLLRDTLKFESRDRPMLP